MRSPTLGIKASGDGCVLTYTVPFYNSIYLYFTPLFAAEAEYLDLTLSKKKLFSLVKMRHLRTVVKL